MKRLTSFRSTVITMAVLMTVLLLSSCQKESQSLNSDNLSDKAALKTGTNISEAKNGAPLKVDLMQGYFRVTDVNGQRITASTPGSTLLYTNNIPMLAPDGHQLTQAEFSMVSGWASIKCINSGTHAVFHMKGLIPNGIYTMWIFTFRMPGADGTFNNRIGAGAFGAPDGSNNSFMADAEGTASISLMLPGGNLGGFGAVGDCLSSVFESHIIAAYHPDQQTHGAGPGAIWVAQLFFPVHGSQL